jgi:hypothetical protein
MSAIAETTIKADPKVPVIRMRREFKATPAQVFPTYSFEGRDAWHAGRMQVGVHEGYANLEEVFTDDTV